MAKTIATRNYRKNSSWQENDKYIQYKWVASLSNRTSNSVKVTITMSAKAHNLTKQELIDVGLTGDFDMGVTCGGVGALSDSMLFYGTIKGVSNSKTITISGISSSSITLATQTAVDPLAVVPILPYANGTSISVPAYVPPKSTPTLPTNAVMGASYSINTNRNKSTYTHTMTYSVGNIVIWSATGVGATASFNAPDTDIISVADLCATIPNSLFVHGTMVTKTYNGSTLIGTTTQSMNLYVPSYSVNFTSSGLTADNTGTNVPTCSEYIKNYTRVKASVSDFTTSYSASLQKFTITCGTNSEEITTAGDVGTLASDTAVKVRGIDTRGVYKDYDYIISLKTYIPPTLTTYNLTRGNNQLVLDYAGNMTELLNSNNVGVNDVTIRIYDETETEKGSFFASHTNGVISGSQTIAWTNLPAYTFNATIVVTDTFGSTATYQVTIATAEVPLQLHWSKKGVAIGKVSETDGTNGLFEIAWDTMLKGNKLGFTQNGEWYYWKSDGLTIAFAQLIVSCGAASSRSGLYSSDFSTSIPSGIFSGTPYVLGTLGERTVTLVGIQAGAGNSTTINGRIFRVNTSSGFNALISVVAFGI